MAFIGDDVFDAALNEIKTATTLVICSAEPANYAGISAVELGSKSSPTFTGPVNGDTSGRKVTVDAITAGNVTATGTASHYVLHDGVSLLAAGSLASSQAVTNGNTFTLTAFDIEFPDPA